MWVGVKNRLGKTENMRRQNNQCLDEERGKKKERVDPTVWRARIFISRNTEGEQVERNESHSLSCICLPPTWIPPVQSTVSLTRSPFVTLVAHCIHRPIVP